jgi:hypothetical protein
MGGFVLKVGFEDQKGRFRKLEKSVQLAIVGGLSDGGRKVFTRLRKQLQAQTRPAKYATITSRTLKTEPSVGHPCFTIFAKNEPIDLAEFKARATASGVKAAPWGVPRVFARSFQDNRKKSDRNTEGFVARVGAKRYPIRALHGPNLAREFLGLTPGSQVPRTFELAAAQEVPKAIVARLSNAIGVP